MQDSMRSTVLKACMELSPIVIEILDAQSPQTQRCNYQVFFRTGRIWMVEGKNLFKQPVHCYIVSRSKREQPLAISSENLSICTEYEQRLALIYLLSEAADLLIVSTKLMLD